MLDLTAEGFWPVWRAPIRRGQAHALGQHPVGRVPRVATHSGDHESEGGEGAAERRLGTLPKGGARSQGLKAE